MTSNPFKEYEQRSNEFAVSQAAVRMIITLTKDLEDGPDYDNNAIIRIGKGVQTELVRLIGEMERNGKGG
jgi:hypothetical protein